MITTAMQLTTRRDAYNWAADMGDLTDEQIERVADWIWANKPEISCRYDEHPICYLPVHEFWAIADGIEQ